MNKFIESIALDKLRHVVGGLMLGFVGILLGDVFDMGLVGAGVATIIVAGKEVVKDGWLGKGNVEFLDFIYSFIPILMLAICYAI